MEGGPENSQEKQLSEEQALEILKSERSLDAGEQEMLVSAITDPDSSIEVVMLTETRGRQFTLSQREHLVTNIERNQDSVYVFFINLAESGVLTELNETEQWLVQRLRGALEQIDDPTAAEYIQEHILPFLPEKNS